MKKTKLFLSLLALSAVLGFASCTKKPKAPSKTDTTITQTTEEKCTVSFDSNGGTNVVAVKVTKGGKLTAPTAPTKVSDNENNYSFDGWYKDQALNQAFDFSKDTITKDTTLYAKWNATPITKYTVTFETNGGSNVTSQQVKVGGKVVRPETDPTKDADDDYTYEFENWYKDQALNQAFDFSKDTITKDTTLYAKWTSTPITKYTVTFETNGGSDVTSQKVKVGGKASRPETDPTKDADDNFTYEFENWYKDSTLKQLFDFNTEIREETTIYANWTKTQIIHTASLNYMGHVTGGSYATSLTGDVNNNITLPTITYNNVEKGYVFLGWATTENATEAEYGGGRTLKLSKDTTFYAVFEQVAIVTYDYNGLNKDSESYSVSANGFTTINTTVPSRDGYTFVGWSKNKDSSTAEYQPGVYAQFIENTTLYAIWTQDPILIFDANGGVATSVPGSVIPDSNGKAVIPNKEPGKAYSRFLGWATSSTATAPQYIAGDELTVTSAVTLYAVWQRTVTVYIRTNNHNHTSSTAVYDAGQEITLNINTTKEHYTFAGWKISTLTNSVDNGYTLTLTEDMTTVYIDGLWTGKAVDIVFERNMIYTAVSGEVSTIKAHFGSTFTVPDGSNYKSDNYEFIGWHWGEFTQTVNNMPTADISIDFAVGDELNVDDYYAFNYDGSYYMFLYAVFREKTHTYETTEVAPTLESNGKIIYTCTDNPDYSYEKPITNSNMFVSYISDVQYVTGRGVSLITTIMNGTVSVGDEVSVVLRDYSVTNVLVTGIITKDNKIIESATKGDNVGIIIRSDVITQQTINVVGAGGVICTKGEVISDVHSIYVKVRLLNKEEGGRQTPFTISYQPLIKVETYTARTTISEIYDVSNYQKLSDDTLCRPGNTYIFKLDTSSTLNAWIGEQLTFMDGSNVIGEGKIIARTEEQIEDYFENNIIVALYEVNGNSAPVYVSVKKNTRWVDIPCPFVKEGYRFVGWDLGYSALDLEGDQEFIELIEFENLYEGIITASVSLAPAWTEI